MKYRIMGIFILLYTLLGHELFSINKIENDEIQEVENHSYVPPTKKNVRNITYNYIQKNKKIFKSLPIVKHLLWSGIYDLNKISRKAMSLNFKIFNNWNMDHIFDYDFLNEDILLNKEKLKLYQDSVYANYINNYANLYNMNNQDSINNFRQKKHKELLEYQSKFLSKENLKKLSEYYKLRFSKTGPVNNMDIIHKGEINSKICILYEDNELDQFIERGYWIALSNDNGNTWLKYYTGLSENHYYNISKNSIRRLWKNDSLIQCNATIVRRMGAYCHPGPGPKYELLDHVVITINLNKIIQDTDNDGLTDIVEGKMFLNPLCPDTDGDGIVDSEDTNPRFKSEISENTLIYQTIIEQDQLAICDTTEFLYSDLEKFYPENRKQSGELSTYLIITNLKDIQTMNPVYDRFIILTRSEFQSSLEQYPHPISRISISPMSRYNDNPNFYVIRRGYGTAGTEYLIIKNETGFKVISIGAWIS